MKRTRSNDETIPNSSESSSKIISLENLEEPPDQLITCSLPPFCHIDPLQFTSTEQFESHYYKFHSFRCSVCRKVFPSEIILDLHITECHDSFASARLAKGEKIVSK